MLLSRRRRGRQSSRSRCRSTQSSGRTRRRTQPVPLSQTGDRPDKTPEADPLRSHRRLFYGDNLDILRDSTKIQPDSVDLCYIDPPFNSKKTYNQIYNNIGGVEDLAQEQAFVDTWTWDDRAREGYDEIISNQTHGYTVQTIELIKGLRSVLGEGSLLAYLVSMTRRVVEIHRVLRPTGSFYLHCDPTSSHYLKLVIDGIFCGGAGDFRNEIIWKRTAAQNSSKRYGPVHDTILYYIKSDDAVWNQQYQPYSETYKSEKFGKVDPQTGERFQDQNLTGPGVRTGPSGQPWRGVDPTAKGRHWQPASYLYTKYKQLTGRDLNTFPFLERLDRLDEVGLIYWTTKKGALPRYKQFLNDAAGLPLQDVWIDIDVINSQADERLGWATQKPEDLLERIIEASSNEGDVVLDAYCGCGTTVAVADRLKRRWIGMDITYQSIALVLKRLEDTFGADVAADVYLDGVPRDLASAAALAHKRDDRVRKEFEKWAVLTYTLNRAAINYKKGADAGIDGTAYFWANKDETAKVVFQVKSGGVGRGDIAKLRGDMDREKAAIGTLITLEESTAPMRLEAKRAGAYAHPLTGRDYDRLRIVTIREILEEGCRLELPLSLEVLKAAQAAQPYQPSLDMPYPPVRTKLSKVAESKPLFGDVEPKMAKAKLAGRRPKRPVTRQSSKRGQ